MTFYNKLNAIFQEYYDQLENIPTVKITDIKSGGEEEITITEERALESWFLAGDFGCGKTLSAIQTVRLWQRYISKTTDYDSEFIDHNPKFTTLQDYIELNNRSIQFKDLHDQIQAIKNSYILVLDDISLTNWSESSINHLTQLIKHRHENRLQTIFTSNKGMKELKKEIPAVMSRITQMCGIDNCILFKAIDYRTETKGMKTKLQK
ncbi:MAG: hypothetical protein ACRCZ2_05225 [Fusobacteriaceae bacterium]